MNGEKIRKFLKLREHVCMYKDILYSVLNGIAICFTISVGDKSFAMNKLK